jgi:23S rRNA (uracil1939-C5)-methyltransferase
MIRKAAATGEIMVALYTESGRWPSEKAFAVALADRCPTLTGLLRIVQQKQKKQPTRSASPANLASPVSPRSPGGLGRQAGSISKLLYGKPQITDHIEGLAFQVSADSFHQVNPKMTLVLYRKTLEYADLTGKEIVVDAYSGIGTIALHLAKQSHQVYGLEIVPEANKDARANAALSGITNIDFRQGAVEDLLPTMVTNGLKPDVVILDPPRRGCAPATLEAITKAKKIVYLSCDPGTLARDLRYLTERGYQIKEVQPVDMFPWTAHIETVSLLTAIDGQ